MLRARQGEDLIIQGPPGTGKSQTIANLIAQSLAEGKKILFVSEKMAALSVVYRRLEEVGLAPFCLELHSDKANKRDTLSRIGLAAQVGKTMTLPPSQVEQQFRSLLTLRRELNEYARALHSPTHFEKTPFDLHGALASRDDIPDVTATIDMPIEDLDSEKELSLLRQARRLSQMPEMLVNYQDHPWFGCKIDSWSMEVQADLNAHLQRFSDALEETDALVIDLASTTGVEKPDSIDALGHFSELVDLVAASPAPPRSWLDAAPLQDLSELASGMSKNRARYQDLRDELGNHYSHADLTGHYVELDESLNDIDQLVLDSLLGDQPKRISLSEVGAELAETLRAVRRHLEDARGFGIQLSQLIGEEAPASLGDLRRLANIMSLAAVDPQPVDSWMDWESLGAVLESCRKARENRERLTELSDAIHGEFTDGFTKLPLDEWRDDFKVRYAGFLRLLKSDYRSRSKEIKATLKSRTSIAFNSMREWVEKGAEYRDISSWFDENRERHINTLGAHYRSDETDWEDLVGRLETIRQILELYRGARPGEDLIACLLTGGARLREPVELGRKVGQLISEIEDSLQSAGLAIDVARLLGLVNGDADLAELTGKLQDIGAQLTRYQEALAIFDRALRPGATRTPEEKAVDARAGRELLEIEENLRESREELNANFGPLFVGLDTDWDKVIDAIDWSASFRRYSQTQGLGDACLDSACDHERIERVADRVSDLKGALAKIQDERGYLVNAIEVDAIRPGETPLDMCALKDLAAWIDVRLSNLGGLSDWIQFQELRRECSSTGLDDFVEKVLEMKVSANDLEQALQKRLLILQLDHVYRKLPVLRTFNYEDHTDLVTRFKRLDRDLMGAYAQIVRAKVAAAQPSLTGPAVGQFGFLRRELTKQRRHAPLRKLFQQCGNILLDITPCLMMSPLSVATFLPKDSVRFDIVIFDEASQVPAEEAIGAILRGSQLIVAGDPKQLPPTRFFERSLDDGLDVYTDEEDEASLESLLDDCAAGGVSVRPLEWHYRSRHESLIAFSNAEFYGNNLITFPPPEDPPPIGMGVRLEFVDDGVYDRGLSRTNRREAQRVAELIRDHLDSGNRLRSLGVIALSSAQENAIREEVERLIESRPDLEQYLKPTGEEPFFVKPLENVQGDERETIIISIGYARAPDGTMSLNFGPINQAGGERRLNVTVTRARRELILVSSIRAGDIDESRVKGSGPKILKRYLQFAEDGRLPPETADPAGESESDFEVAVWQALRDQGLDVDRQVGCSRYRIDLAIRDPKHPGKYLLGVECDGAPYHSSVVARDRDRLRQQILEQLGWKIHRVWSTDWVRDRDGALKRLLYRIEELDGEDPPLDPEPVEPADHPWDDGDLQQSAVDDENLTSEFDHLDDAYEGLVAEHTDTKSSDRTREDFYDGDDSDVLEVVMRVVFHEGPIHEDELTSRVARMYDLKRTGAAIETVIGRQIKLAVKGKRIRRAGHFLWPVSLHRIVPRRPGAGARSRRVEHVPPEEFDEAALLVARLSGGVPLDELMPEVARVLGYGRTGNKVDKEARKAVNRLRRAAVLTERGGFLFEATTPNRGPPTELGGPIHDHASTEEAPKAATKARPRSRTGVRPAPQALANGLPADDPTLTPSNGRFSTPCCKIYFNAEVHKTYLICDCGKRYQLVQHAVCRVCEKPLAPQQIRVNAVFCSRTCIREWMKDNPPRSQMRR